MKWVIQQDRSNDKADEKLYKIFRNLVVHKLQIFNYKPFMNLNDIKDEIFKTNESILCLGSIPFISKIQRIPDLIPGSYCNFEAFECKNYYPILGKLMLNSDYYITTWKKLLKNRFEGVRFIRPNSGKKIFTGTITDHDHLTQDVGLSISNIQNNTLVFVTWVKEIEFEWRFFVSSKGDILSSSLYHKDGKLKIEKGCNDHNAVELASKVCNNQKLNELIKDPVYVVDICKDEFCEYKVVELNSFSCSGFYDCDLRPIVDYINK